MGTWIRESEWFPYRDGYRGDEKVKIKLELGTCADSVGIYKKVCYPSGDGWKGPVITEDEAEYYYIGGMDVDSAQVLGYMLVKLLEDYHHASKELKAAAGVREDES